MNGPIRTLVNVKYLPPNSSGNLMGRWKVGVDDQGVVLLLTWRERNFDQVRVCLCVLRHESLDFLHGGFSFGLRRANMNTTYFVHYRIRVLGNLARRYGVPVKGWSLPRPPGDLRWIQPSILVGIAEIHIGVGRFVRYENFHECRLCPPVDVGGQTTTTGVDVRPVILLQNRLGSERENRESPNGNYEPGILLRHEREVGYRGF